MNELKALREMAALSQAELAQRAGTLRWRIAHAENGLIELTPEELAAVRNVILESAQANAAHIAAALGTSISANEPLARAAVG
jgi:DNA-binding XRE family transcriptional regulator